MKPLLTLTMIFGPGYIMNGRGSYHNSQWLPSQVSQDSSSGSLLAVAGDFPIVCHEDVSRTSCLPILQTAGLQVGQNLLTYKDEKSYYYLLNDLQTKGKRVIFNYSHLPNEFNETQYWINRAVLLFLNNKKNLGELVPKKYVPRRKVLSIDQFMNNDNIPFELPYVVKAATDQPNGGGIEVVICKTPNDLQQAKKLFHTCSFVVIEEFLAVKRNFCVQFIQTYTGDLVYLGSAEQVITEEGKYAGNWIDVQDQTPVEAIELCKQVMEKAVLLGYWGFAGIDTVITEDNQIFIIDLNFRQNGSTVALVLKDSIMNCLEVKVLKVGKWKTHSTFDKFSLLVESLIGRKLLVPLCIYNPTIQTDDKPISLSGVIVGNSKDEIKEVEQQMKAMGFE